MKLVIDLSSNTVVGATDDTQFSATATQALIDIPEGFDMAAASEWAFDGITLTRDPVAALNRAKAARKTRIKAEAAMLIGASDWRLNRAREQEAAGWVTLAEVDSVLAGRESIRRSSNAAELALDALTDSGSVQAFVWSVAVLVPAPRRLTQVQFASRFTDLELQAILAAAQVSPPLGAWWEKFKLASDINLDDVATQGGVQALEFSGLLTGGRAVEILA